VSDYVVIIPARYGSTRLPGKPLRDIAGRPMIEHVCRRALESAAARVIVATDDERIAEAGRAAGVEVVMTASSHDTGTDRLAEVAARLALDPDTVVVNLQGDEPLMPPSLLDRVAAELAARPGTHIATLSVPLAANEVDDPNVVKVVTARDGHALYFSRAVVPFPRDSGDLRQTAPGTWQRHLGLYAYRAELLRRFPVLEPPAMERLEKLEQLRALWHGYRIAVVAIAEPPPAGVDTLQDLERVAEWLRRGDRPGSLK
jgi:3-deoxy-manno-octulosonate cytidylyltransferase (CMP-KDO synthetase)